MMAEFNAEIADITIDCTDPELVATFWATLLGRPIEGRKGPYVWLKRLGGGTGMGFQGWWSRRLAGTACTLTSPALT